MDMPPWIIAALNSPNSVMPYWRAASAFSHPTAGHHLSILGHGRLGSGDRDVLSPGDKV